MIKTVIKHRYFSGKRAKRSVREYTNYVAYRSGRDRKLGGRKFFSKDRDEISATEVKAILREQSDRGVVAHELMLSPGLQTVDRNDYAREIMKELERKKGLELQWYAVSHEGDHSHIHVIVSGSDANGRKVLFRREDYKNIREWGDRYLEKYHELERYLDRKILEYKKDYELSYERQKGDKLYELLFAEEKKAEEVNLSALLESWDRRRAIAELEDQEKIYLEREVYHKYSKVEELESLDVRLLGGSEARLPKEQYKKLRTWISEKNEYGDDHHERLARESHVRKLVKDMDPEERRKLEKKLEKMAQEREAKYREEDKKKEEERRREDERIRREKEEEELQRKEEEERLEQERKEEDERREKEKLEEKIKELERLEEEQRREDERIEEERRQEDERRVEEKRLEEERLEKEAEEERLEEDRRVKQERKLEELKEKLELARKLEEEKLQAEQERRKEALETIKDFKGFDRDFEQAYQGQSPGEKLFSKKGREQRIQEKRGEYTEWHIRYQNSMARNALEEKMAREPHLKDKIQEDIEKIKELEVKQLESEKLEPIDLEELEANANKYLFEEEEQEKSKEEGRDRDDSGHESKDKAASKEELGILKGQLNSIENERAIAKEIEFIELDDGTRLTKDSDEKALNEYQDQLIEKIRSNYEEGHGYLPDDEIKWTAIEEWKESKREAYELEKADFRDNLDESLRQLSHESYEKHKEQRLRALGEIGIRRDEMYEDGFYDEDGNLVNKDTDTDKLLEIVEALNEEDKALDEAEERGEIDEDFFEKNIDIESKKLVIKNWMEEKSQEKEYEQEYKEREARLKASDLEEIKLEDGTSLSKDSDLKDIRAFKEELENADVDTMRMLYLAGKNEDEYLDYVTKYSAVERWEDENVERTDSVDYEKIWQARMEALEITEIKLEDGTVITPDLDAKTLNERSKELFDKEREFEKGDKNSKEYYEIARDSAAINNWHTIKEIEETVDRGESYWLFGIELDFENDKPFGEDTPIKEKIERIQEATNLAIEYQTKHGYASDDELHPVRKAELKLKLQGILIPDQELERIESDLEQSGKDVYEPLKGLEENIERHIYLLKDPKEERSLEKDEFDDLMGFPEDERDEEDRQRDEDTEKDKDVADDIDKGDQGDKGDTGSKGRESDDSTKLESKPIVDIAPSPEPEKEQDSGRSDRAEDDKGPDKDDDFFDR